MSFLFLIKRIYISEYVSSLLGPLSIILINKDFPYEFMKHYTNDDI